MGKDLPDIWKLGPLCHTFEDTENTRDQLLASFVGTLLDWSHACGFTTQTFHSSFYRVTIILYIIILLATLCAFCTKQSFFFFLHKTILTYQKESKKSYKVTIRTTSLAPCIRQFVTAKPHQKHNSSPDIINLECREHCFVLDLRFHQYYQKSSFFSFGLANKISNYQKLLKPIK